MHDEFAVRYFERHQNAEDAVLEITGYTNLLQQVLETVKAETTARDEMIKHKNARIEELEKQLGLWVYNIRKR